MKCSASARMRLKRKLLAKRAPKTFARRFEVGSVVVFNVVLPKGTPERVVAEIINVLVPIRGRPQVYEARDPCGNEYVVRDVDCFDAREHEVALFDWPGT